jgi:hypothetical protein
MVRLDSPGTRMNLDVAGASNPFAVVVRRDEAPFEALQEAWLAPEELRGDDGARATSNPREALRGRRRRVAERSVAPWRLGAASGWSRRRS